MGDEADALEREALEELSKEDGAVADELRAKIAVSDGGFSTRDPVSTWVNALDANNPVRQYIEKHEIHCALDAMLTDIVQQRPENPYDFALSSWVKRNNSKLTPKVIRKFSTSSPSDAGYGLKILSQVRNGDKSENLPALMCAAEAMMDQNKGEPPKS